MITDDTPIIDLAPATIPQPRSRVTQNGDFVTTRISEINGGTVVLNWACRVEASNVVRMTLTEACDYAMGILHDVQQMIRYQQQEAKQ
jgi:hypothetical protein